MKDDRIPSELWLDIAKQLPVGGKASATACCKNGTRKSMQINHYPKGYSAYCHVCHSKGWHAKGELSIHELRKQKELETYANSVVAELPSDFTLEIPTAGMLWLLSGNVRPRDARAYRIGWSERLGRVVIPIYYGDSLQFVQCRDVSGTSDMKYLNLSNVPKQEILGWSNSTQQSMRHDLLQHALVLTEDFLSTIVVGDVCRAASLMGTTLSDAQLGKILASHYNTVIIWLDGDDAGIKGARTIQKQLALVPVRVLRVFTERDPKLHSRAEIEMILTDVVRRADGHNVTAFDAQSG